MAKKKTQKKSEQPAEDQQEQAAFEPEGQESLDQQAAAPEQPAEDQQETDKIDGYPVEMLDRARAAAVNAFLIQHRGTFRTSERLEQLQHDFAALFQHKGESKLTEIFEQPPKPQWRSAGCKQCMIDNAGAVLRHLVRDFFKQTPALSAYWEEGLREQKAQEGIV